MAKKKKNTTQSRSGSVKVSRRRSTRSASPIAVGRLIVPAIVLLLLIAGIVYMAVSGYESATSSSFFRLTFVDVRGTERTSKDEITKVVTMSAERSGVWNADLAEIKVKLEKFPFVKTASVTRALPAGIRVNIIERVPAAVVKLASGYALVDNEGVILVPAKGNEKEFPFVLQGWDESKTEKAGPDNLARLKIYKKMVDESVQFDVAARIKEFNLANIRQPVAVVEDSGRSISVSLARDDLGRSLKTAIEALTGKGAKIRSINSVGVQPIIQYLDL